MGATTGIQWTDSTWNPVTGCTKVSAGCDHCYAETLAERFRGVAGHYYENGFDVQLREDKLTLPLRWTRPRMVFVNSMSDLFHASVPDSYIVRVFAVMALAEGHTFQVLTKRHGRMRALVGSRDFPDLVTAAAVHLAQQDHSPVPRAVRDRVLGRAKAWLDPLPAWPLPNVWLGVSVENQQWADARIPALAETPAAVRFLSCEPLLGPVNLTWKSYPLDWIIVGGESGRGARPMHPDWARSLRDFAVGSGIAFHFKQRGEWTWTDPDLFRLPSEPYTDRVAVMHPAGMVAMTKSNPFDPFKAGHPDWFTRIERVGKRAAGRLLDGRTWDEFPAVDL